MSGHSKWSTIKRQKGAADAKRSAVFGKLANALTIAARHGTDPSMNFQLRIAVDKAKTANMPKDNIERAIERASGSGANALEEVIFEAYGPGGTAFLIEAATDNRNRTVGDIRATLNKYDGKLAETGSVQYLFKKIGQIIFETDQAEELELAAIDAGAEDVEQNAGIVMVTTETRELEAVRQRLATAGYESNDVSLVWHSTVSIPITEPKLAERVEKLFEHLEDLDDVTKVSSNFEITDLL